MGICQLNISKLALYDRGRGVYKSSLETMYRVRTDFSPTPYEAAAKNSQVLRYRKYSPDLAETADISRFSP